MTSHDVVARARRVLSVRRVGHAGTLDPMATGLLILGVGAATRLLGYVGGHDKTYEATIRLGQSTVTDDRGGRGAHDGVAPAHLDDDAIRAALAAQTGPLAAGALVGERGQGRRPPLLRPRPRRRGGRAGAALGHRAPARRAPDRAGRPPDLVDVDVTVACTAGTYIRAIARDAGAALGVGGHLTALRRTASGPFVGRRGRTGRGGRRGAGRGRRSRASSRSPTPPPPSSRRRDAHRGRDPARSATASGSPPPARRGCTPPSTPTAGWSPCVEDAGTTARVAVGFPAGLWHPPDVTRSTTRLAALDAQLAPLPGVLVAFSGGVDSGVLLAAAVRALGADRVVAATAVSPSLPASERWPAAAFAASLGVRHELPRTDELSRDGLRRQRRRPVRVLQDRAGRRAARRWPPGSASPTSSPARTPTTCGPASGRASGPPPSGARGRRWPGAGMTKDDVRAAARRWGLPLADKPAAACLASRIAYGVPVSAERPGPGRGRRGRPARGAGGGRPAGARTCGCATWRRRRPGRGRRRRWSPTSSPAPSCSRRWPASTGSRWIRAASGPGR